MIEKHEMLLKLIEVCPSFVDELNELRDFYEEEINYVELGAFSNHLVDLYQKGETDSFSEIFEVVEKFHIEGDEYVKEAATVGLLEGLQNVAGNRDLDPDVFLPYLNPVSAEWWEKLNKFWSGETQVLM